MRRITAAVFIAVTAICLWLLISKITTPRRVAVRNESPQTVVLDKTSAKPIDYYNDEKERAALAESVTSKIDPGPDETIISVFSVNLDTDESDEQIISVKKKSDPSGAISVVLADYDSARKKWFRSWEGKTQATNTKMFTVKTYDAIGDHNQNILCFGMNEASEQTLSVFWRTFERSDGTLTYKEIFDLKADYVEVQELPRSAGYQLGQINGVSWPIVAWIQDTSSQNPLDRIQATYEWNFRDGKYEKTRDLKVKGSEIERIKLDAMISKNGENFETFLDGLWLKNENPSVPDWVPSIIMFNSGQKTITFHADDTEELYQYSSLTPRKYGVSLLAKNESIPTMSRFIDVELTAVDTVAFRIRDNINLKIEAQDIWSGSYRKMTEALQSAYASPKKEVVEPMIILSGPYRAANGLEINFTTPHFSMKTNDVTENGGYAIYRVGQSQILDLRIFRENGLVKETRIFKLEQKETKAGKTTRKIITLMPAKTSIMGVTLTDGTVLVLEQS